MKTEHTFKKTAFFCLFFSLLLSITAFTANEHDVFVAHLISEGKTLIENNEYLEASHVLAKAMMIDPDNTEAKSLLTLLDHGLYSSKNRSFQDVFDENESIKSYQKKIVVLEKKIKSTAKTASDEKIKYRFQLNALKQKLANLTDKMNENENLLEHKNKELARLNENFENLEKRFQLVKNEGEKERTMFTNELAMLHEELSAFQSQQQSLKNKIALMEVENDSLRNKIVSIKRSSKMQSSLEKALLENMKHVVLKKDHEISQLKKEFAASNRYVNETLQLISEKNQEVAIFNTGIKQLKQSINNEKIDWQNKQHMFVNKINNLNRDLKLSQQTIVTIHEGQRQRMDHLNKSLAKNQLALNESNSNVTELQHQIRDKNKSIKNLEGKLTKLESKLSKLRFQEKSFAATDRKEEIHNTVLTQLKQKDSVIMELKGKLADAKRQLARLEKDINQSAIGDFLALKERLIDIQVKLEDQLTTIEN